MNQHLAMCNFIIEQFSEYYWYIGIIHFVMAVVLFFIVNWIGAHSISIGYMQMSVVIKADSAPAFNFLFKVLAPLVYLILVATLCQQIGLSDFTNKCYLIVIFYWIFRALWIICTGRGGLINWTEQVAYWICSIGLAIWIYSIIERVDKILPDPRSLLDQVWILIIVFIYSILNKVQLSRDKTIKRKENYIEKRYNKFKKKYDNIIKSFFNNDFYEAVTYSIMIYEDFNRPIIVRWIEYLSFLISRKTHTLGIMQVITSKYINNEESIRIAIRKIKDDGEKIQEKKYDYKSSFAYAIAEQYNGGDYSYAGEVQEVYRFIAQKFYNILDENVAGV